MMYARLISPIFLAAAAIAGDVLTPDSAVADIQKNDLRQVLASLDQIAKGNGGNRAFGLPGYDASVDYVLEQFDANQFDITVDSFTHLYSTTRSIYLKGPDGEDVPIVSLGYNHATPSCGVSAPLYALPVDDERGTGCTPDQWNVTDFTTKIPLVKRGTKCHFPTILKLAKQHRAPAVVIWNNVPGQTGGSASLGAEWQGQLAPVVVVTYEQGVAWYERVQQGQTINVKLAIDVLTEERETRQVFAETKEGDSENIIMMGAHLDSVQEGPGINDNGSGVATLIAAAKSLAKYTGLKNKVRFAFWGAEEVGMIGSINYLTKLSEEEANKIRFYFNYDMTASPQPAYFIYADTDAHKAGGQILHDYLVEQGLEPEFIPFGASSDYIGFLELGIPSSSIITGAGNPYDVCYHTKCDDLNNAHLDALTVNAKAAVYALAHMGLQDAAELPERATTSTNPQSKRGIHRNLARWAVVARGVDKARSCGDMH